VVDGIQVATGCTLGKGNIAALGKGNIAVKNLGKISAVFRSKRQAIQVKMKMDVFQSIKEQLSDGDPEKMEETARKVSSMPDTSLFDTEKVQKYVKGK